MAKKKTKKQNQDLGVNMVNNVAMSWCMEQGYKVYPIPLPICKGKYECNSYKIVVERAGKKKIGQKEYSDSESQKMIWSIYNQLYNKHYEKKKE